MGTVELGMATNTILLLLLGSLPMLLEGLPILQSTTVHRILPNGRVKSHGGFLGGYGFKITGLTRSYVQPDFVLRGLHQQEQYGESQRLEVEDQEYGEPHRFEVEEQLSLVEEEEKFPVLDSEKEPPAVDDEDYS